MSRILIISDDQAFAYSLRVLLKRDGHSVMVADDSSAGLFRLFVDRPWFVVVNLYLESEARKVCRHLLDHAKIPFLILGKSSLLKHPELETLTAGDCFQPLPSSVRRIWSRITEMLKRNPGPVKTGSEGVSGSDTGAAKTRTRGKNAGAKRDRSADHQCRTYERNSRINLDAGRRSALEIWV